MPGGLFFCGGIFAADASFLGLSFTLETAGKRRQKGQTGGEFGKVTGCPKRGRGAQNAELTILPAVLSLTHAHGQCGLEQHGALFFWEIAAVIFKIEEKLLYKKSCQRFRLQDFSFYSNQ